MTKISQATETSPQAADLLPFGRPADSLARHMEAGALLGLGGQGFLDAATLAGATSATLKGVPPWLGANLAWLLLDPYTSQAEIRKITGASGNALTFAALAYAHAASDAAMVIPDAVFDSKWFGARGDGSTDDRTAIQATLAAANAAGGGNVLLPHGIADCTRGAGNYIFDMTGMANIRVIGRGIDQTVIRWRPNIAWEGDTHTFWVRNASNISFSDFTIDGSFGVGTTSFGADQQRHGIRLEAATSDVEGIYIERVKFHRLRGDGVYILGYDGFWSQQVWLRACQFLDNGRSGFVLNGARRIFAIGNYFENMDDQWLDAEGTNVRDVIIAFNIAEHTNDVNAVQFSGESAENPQQGISFLYNKFNGGGIFMSHVINSQFIGNEVVGSATHRPIDGRGRIENVRIKGNTFTQPGGEECLSFSAITGTGATDLSIIDNDLILAGEAGSAPVGIFVFRGNRVRIAENRIRRTGSGSWTGVQLSATDAGVEVYDDMAVEDNRFYNLATAISSTVRNGNKYDGLSTSDNRFYDCTTSVHINSAAYNPIAAGSDFYFAGNIYSGVTTKLNNESAIAYWKTGQNEFEGNGTPEEVVTAPVGAIYRRLDGGVGTAAYLKLSGTGNTGWVGIPGLSANTFTGLQTLPADGLVMANNQIATGNGNVGVGAAASATHRLLVRGAASGGVPVVRLENGDETNTILSLVAAGVRDWQIRVLAASGRLVFHDATGGADRLAIDTSGRIFLNLPTVDPAVSGALWNDGGIVKVSA